MCRDLLWILSLSILVCANCLHASNRNPKGVLNGLKSSVYHSPPFFQRPGSVVNKFYLGIPFPNGHIAVKSFDAEVVDEMGVPVPLHETYLHHWVVVRYYGPKEDLVLNKAMNAGDVDLSKIIVARNAGICKYTLSQYFGLGSETRKTSTWVPGAYGIEIGNPEEVPDGYEERWLLNVHAIDTRGVEDRLGCTECKCSLYNVTKDKHGNPLRKNYNGGLECCYDQTQCRTRQAFQGSERKLYLRYRVTWDHWDNSVLPVKIYIFDVTDIGTNLSNDTILKGNAPSSTCKVEYDVEACGIEGKSNAECIDTKKTRVVLPIGGDIIYGVAHQHSGGAGSALYGQDGRLLCSSMPYYGKGKEAGDEAGYIVGMSTCYPTPGSIKVADGEHLTLVSNYSSSRHHTGVMGLFYILVAEEQRHDPTLHHTLPVSWTKKGGSLSNYTWAFIFIGGIVAVVIGVLRSKRYNGEGGYETLAIA